MKARLVLLAVTLFSLFTGSVWAQYPKKPLTFVVGFGVGGSADRMTRALTPYLAEELGQPIRVVNKKGAGTQIAASYVLRKPADGYTVFASTLSPYLGNTILHGSARYGLDDWIFINGQWWDFDLIAANRDKPYKTLDQIFADVKAHPKKLSVSVVQGSAGHLMVMLLLEAYGIPKENLNIVTYNSGSKARSAVAGGQVDFVSISAEGSESIREFLTPLAVVLDKPSDAWDAPTVNEAIASTGKTLPVLAGSIRGFAVSKQFKAEHPERFARLVDSFKNVLSRDDVKSRLVERNIGAEWVGPEQTQAAIQSNFELFKKHGALMSN